MDHIIYQLQVVPSMAQFVIDLLYERDLSFLNSKGSLPDVFDKNGDHCAVSDASSYYIQIWDDGILTHSVYKYEDNAVINITLEELLTVLDNRGPVEYRRSAHRSTAR